MQDGVLNLCRVKLRDQQRLDRTHVMEEYPQYPNGTFGEAVPRAGNASGGGQPGLDPEVQGLGDRSQRVHLLHHAGAGVEGHLQGDRPRGMADRPALRDAQGAPAAPDGDLRRDREVDDDQDQVRGDGHPEQVRHSVRPDPVDEGARRGAVAAQDRAPSSRSTIRSAASTCRSAIPIKLSDSPTEVKRSPLLGEHTDEVLAELGYSREQIEGAAFANG